MSARLHARVFYGVIAAGVLLGALAAGAGAWDYVRGGAARPDARHIWADVAGDFVIPLAVMMGSTFGGLAGVAAAVGLEKWSARRRA